MRRGDHFSPEARLEPEFGWAKKLKGSWEIGALGLGLVALSRRLRLFQRPILNRWLAMPPKTSALPYSNTSGPSLRTLLTLSLTGRTA